MRVRAQEIDVNLMGQMIRSPTAKTIQAAAIRMTVRFFAISGGLFGLAMGVAGGLAIGSVRSAVRVGMMGLVAGALMGGPGGLLFIPAHERAEDAELPEMAISLVSHLGLWVPLGLVGGLALGLGARSRRRVMPVVIGGVAGAVIGTISFEFLGALAFPLAETGRPISGTATTRLVAWFMILATSATGSAAALASLNPPREPKSSPS